MRLIAFGTYDVRAHPRVGVLIEGLRARGHEVVEVNEPLRIDTATRVAILRQPWRLGILVAELARCWAVLAWRAGRARRRHRPDAVLVGYLGHFDVHLAALLFRRTPLVLDHLVSAAGTARDRGLAGHGGTKARLMEVIDRAALSRADLVVVDTEEHLEALPERTRGRAAVCPVGAGSEWFELGRVASRRPVDGPLRAVFVGVFTPLHGTPVLAEALAALADSPIEVTMVGTGQDHARARELAATNPSVRWVDWVASAELPAFVAQHDVSLGIFGTTAKALDVVPTKVYQGAAAGCAIVTSDTPPQRDALGDAAVLVPPGDARALADALRGLAADPAGVARLRAAAHDRALDRYTPSAVVQPMVARLAANTRGTSMITSAPPPLTPRARMRWPLIREAVAGARPGSILEIGCGMGSVGARLAGMAPSYTAVEPDPASFAAADARISSLGGRVLNGDHRMVQGGSTFDLVCAFEVLEHIDDDEGALRDWVELVRPSGHLVLSVPADPERFGPSDELVGHYRRYSSSDLAARLAAAGLVDVTIRHYGWPLGYLLDGVRDRLAQRRLGTAAETPQERSSTSGRLFQPRGAAASAAVAVGVAPFVALQALRPAKGPGLVATARRPG